MSNEEQGKVQDRSRNGWLLYGQPYGGGGKGYTYQAMILLEDNEKSEEVVFIPKTNRLGTIS